MSRILNHYALYTLTGNIVSAMDLTANLSMRTVAVKTERSTGYAALFLTVAGTTDVYQQVSVDSSNWSEPVDTDGTNLGVIISATVATSQFIVFDPILAPFTRFVFVGQGTPTITASLYQQEEI